MWLGLLLLVVVSVVGVVARGGVVAGECGVLLELLTNADNTMRRARRL